MTEKITLHDTGDRCEARQCAITCVPSVGGYIELPAVIINPGGLADCLAHVKRDWTKMRAE